MREQFRDWTPKGDIKVNYKDAHGEKKHEVDCAL